MAHEHTNIGPYEIVSVASAAPWRSNTHLIHHRDSGDIGIIDPAGDADVLVDVAHRMAGTVRGIFLTHGHPDHTNAVPALQAAFAVPCFVHTDEQVVLEDTSAWPMSMARQSHRLSDVEYFDGDGVGSLGGTPVAVFRSPGHTPGSVCFLFDGFAFTGDTIYREGIGRTDLPGSDREELGTTLSRLLDGLADDTVLLTGHGAAWTAKEARDWRSWMRGIY